MRRLWVGIHRYVGLLMVLFLLIAGLTGSGLAFYHELDSWINRDVMRVSQPSDAHPLTPFELRERLLQQHPEWDINWVQLKASPPDHAVSFYVDPKVNPVSQQPYSLDFDEIFVNPYTAEVTGQRMWGDINQGMINFMPFVYKLHYQLALKELGTLIMGVIAILWTIDCFIGAYLTFPQKSRKKNTVKGVSLHQRWINFRQWCLRWKPAWKIRLHSSRYKFNYDLHTAGGLWTWAMLFILAWSSVAFNLYDEVYHPITSAVFGMQEQPNKVTPKLPEPLERPALDFVAAHQLGQAFAEDYARQHGLQINFESAIGYDSQRGLYRYQVNTSADVSDRYGQTRFFIDAQTSTLKGVVVPTGVAAGDTITNWIMTLHMGAVWGLPFQIFICFMGIVVSALSITGLVIWWRKRSARILVKAKR